VNVLYATANSFLRSTTSSLNAIIRELMPRGLRPVMLFKERGPWQQALEDEGISCYLQPMFVPDKRRPVKSAAHTWSLIRLLRRERIRLIHCNEHELYPALRVGARTAGVPILTSLHWTLEPGFGHWAFGRPYMPAALQFLSRGQLQLSKDGIPPDYPPDRVKLLMSGLFLDDFLARGGSGQDLRRGWGADDNTVVLGTASAIKRRKRLEDFIRIVSTLHASGRPVIGVIAGGGMFEDADYREELERLIVQEGLQGRCRFIGNMDPVTPFFRAIDIAVNTSEMEILSMSMCEAMACAVPTIAYDVGGNAETVHEAWCAVPFGAVDALADKAARLVDDRAFRTHMGRAANRQAAIYEEILGTGALRIDRATPAQAHGIEA
jgi:glycosyltransferase involved in cell wall biosynthesis